VVWGDADPYISLGAPGSAAMGRLSGTLGQGNENKARKIHRRGGGGGGGGGEQGKKGRDT